MSDPAARLAEFGPVLDDHLHLDPVNGRGVEAVDDFARLGGTHLLVLNKPSWLLGTKVSVPDDFRDPFDITVGAVEGATERLDGRAWPVLGVHPALISKLVDRGYSPEAARDLMQAGLDVAAEYVADGPALAIKSGRPHYEVSDAVWEASNEVMCHAFERAAEVGCAVQLHTEGGTEFTEVAEWAEDRGLPREQVVKHFAEGGTQGPIPSVIAKRGELEAAIDHGRPFMMETDFIDDPDRPGAVLGPKTVPKRTAWLLREGHEDAARTAHVETPALVYGIDTEATLG
jgi:TatD-related deoxyribonuclease